MGMAEKKEAKVCLLGTTAVGKTSLSVRFCQNMFYEQAAPTIGGSFLCKTMHIQGSTVKLEIWDTAGQERFRSLAPMYYRGASSAVVVYDQSNAMTFDRAREWVRQVTQTSANPNIVIALAANKADLHEGSERAVPLEDAQGFADREGLLFVETSAKTGKNVAKL